MVRMTGGFKKTRATAKQNNKKKDNSSKTPPDVTANDVVYYCAHTACGKVIHEDSEAQAEERSIQCDSCSKWLHQQCTDILVSEYKCLTKAKSSSLKFICQYCLEAEVKPNKKLDEIEKKVSEIFNLVNNLKAFLKDTVREEVSARFNEEINKKVDDVKIELNKEIKTNLEEETEKEKRKNNLIILNIPESVKKTPEERTIEDKVAVENILKKIEGSILPEEFTQPCRLGIKRAEGQSRPLKITVKTVNRKIEILRGASRINEGVDFASRIYINNDLTQAERKADKDMRDRLREKRKEGGRWKIKNKEIISEDNKHPQRDEYSSSPAETTKETMSSTEPPKA